jgi:hypothetical protein
MSSTQSRNPLVVATAIGTVLQVAMVVIGHSVPAVAAQFALVGTLLSLVAGLIYALLARTSVAEAAKGGAIAGAVCALLGVLVSLALGDVTAVILAIGTVSGIVAGAIGGAAGSFLARRTASA